MPAQVLVAFKSYVTRLHDSLHRRKSSKPRLVISAPFDFKKEDSMVILPGTAANDLYMLREKAAASIVGSALTLYNDDNDSYAYRSGSSEKLAAAHNLRMQRSTSSLDRKHQLQSQYHHHVQAAQRQQTTPAAKTSRRRSIRLRSHSLKLPRSMTLPQALPGQDAQLAPNSSNSSTHRCHRCRMAMAADAQAADTWAADMDRTRTLYAPRPRRPVVLASSLELFAPAGLSLPSSASSASQD